MFGIAFEWDRIHFGIEQQARLSLLFFMKQDEKQNS
jgi:hypothetical protein